MKRSESCNEIAGALAEAQAEMKNPGFDAQNPHFRNRFASLAAVRNAVIPAMAKHGISVVQELTNGDGGVSCLTVLHHKSGQWMEFGPLTMPLVKIDPQTVGSASTYGKRYSLQAVAGVVGDEDDDAEQAQARDYRPDARIKEFADRLNKAFEVGISGPVLSILDELQEDAELKVAVWGKLGSAMRRQIKDWVEEAKS